MHVHNRMKTTGWLLELPDNIPHPQIPNALRVIALEREGGGGGGGEAIGGDKYGFLFLFQMENHNSYIFKVTHQITTGSKFKFQPI